MYGAIFNSYNLGTGNYFISSIDIKMPKSKLNKYELVRSDGQIVTSKFYGERKIIIEGRINANNFDEMQERLDTLKVWTTGYEKPLDISIANTNRRYTATVEELATKVNGYSCEFTITFSCSSIGYEPSLTTLSFGTYTANNTNYNNTVAGTYQTSPYIDFTVNSVIPYWNNKFLQFKNPVTNQRIRITRQWSFGDRVVIDGYNKTCRIYSASKTTLDNFDSVTNLQSSHTVSLDVANMIEGYGCAKVVMGGVLSSTSVYKENISTAIDMSSTAGKVLIPIFIPTPVSGTISKLKFDIGSNSNLVTNSLNWEITTQYDGSSIATNAWNYFLIDLATTPTNTFGTPNRSAIKSWSVTLSDASNFRIDNWLIDYISIHKSNPISSGCDYEGTFIDLEVGSSNILVEDELTARNISISGGYYKRFI